MTDRGRVNREMVLEALSRICDSETQVPITRLGQVDSVELGVDGRVEVSFHPVSPYTPLVLIAKLALDIAATLRSLEEVTVFKVKVSGHPLSDYLNSSLDKVLGPHETK